MKRIYFAMQLAIISIFSNVQATSHTLNQASGTLGVQNSAYVNNMTEIWDINTGSPKAVKFTFTLNSEEEYDFLMIYSIDNNGVSNCVYNSSGYQSGSITTVLPTGKARVVFSSDGSNCYADGSTDLTGFTTSFSVDNSYYVSQDLQVTGKSFLNGNVGIGNSNPQYKLDLSGDIQLTGKLGIGLSSQTSYNSRTFGNYSLGWYSDSWTSSGPTLWQSAWGGMKFFTNGLPRFVINNTGNVGIGTTEPKNKLQITEASQTELYGTDQDTPTSNMVLDGTEAGRTIGKGPALTFRMPANSDGSNSWAQARILATPDNANNGDARGRLYLQVRDAYNPGTGGSWNWRTGLMITANGNVGIGTTPNALYKLDVKGAIRATEVKIVSIDNFPDFVFDQAYQLPSLGQVSSFIQTNKHLPNIPSATEVKENGINMVEMQNKLLQKVEELTLYVIEQQKQIDELKKNQK
jgi:hypothetical protein